MMIRRVAALVASLLGATSAIAADGETLFRERVRPVLERACFSCHSHDAKKSKGGLVVDSRAALLAGGDSGPAIVPGKPDESPLVTAVGYQDEDLRMPPKGQLAPAEIDAIREWVRLGAPWPGEAAGATVRARGGLTDEDRQWWAIQPLRDAAPPAGPGQPIDRFIRAKLQAAGLSPSPPAEPATLIRRLTFDLTGLPPTPEEVEAFVRDPSEAAYEALVDRLLASPHYGERQARAWLDLVRYAESDGFRLDAYRPQAWRYRDYVIRSFNDDKPYGRFLAEQLAGDEIAPDDPDALDATAYLRLGIYEYNNRDVRGQWTDLVNDVTDVTGDVFLGLGMGCARCHDHKYDPILQKDYYRLQAFFTPMQPRDDVAPATPAQRADYQKRLAAWEAKTVEIRRKIAAIEDPLRARLEKMAIGKFPADVQAIMRKPQAERTPLEQQLYALAYRQVQFEFDRMDRSLKDDAKRELIALRQELAKAAAAKPTPLPEAMTCTDVGPEAPPTVIPKKSGTPIEPGFLTILDEKPAVIAKPTGPTTGRRAALAAWLNRPDNPLTWRVIVNRVWQGHFGRGLVASASDFGRLGEPPTHPDLLDWLARRFQAEGQSLKSLHKWIVMSQTYRQASVPPSAAVAKLDPENRLLWTMPVRRLDAEQVRDALLATTGRLDLAPSGPSVTWDQPRRTIYTRVLRNSRDALLDVFDVPEGFQSTARRNVTTTPLQALLLFNSPFMQTQAKAFAARLLAQPESRDELRLDRAYQWLYSRRPTAEERELALAFLQRRLQAQPSSPTERGPELSFGRLPGREGRGVIVDPSAAPSMVITEADKLPDGAFTIEAFVLLKTLYDSGAVRPIVSQGTSDGRGWQFGVTSLKSRYKPQMLVLQLWGKTAAGDTTVEDAVFSGLHIDLNKPYYVSAVYRPGPDGPSVTFHSKDLSNDDEPMQTYEAKSKIVSITVDRPFRVGTTAGKRAWDGLIDDVRLSSKALGTKDLLLTTDGISEDTVAYWQFESSPGPLRDSSPNGLDLTTTTPKRSRAPANAHQAAWADLCHVLLNTNEFLYLD